MNIAITCEIRLVFVGDSTFRETTLIPEIAAVAGYFTPP
jgi:hypothetical protein